MLWVKAFHIIFVVTWFAGLFYLPRLFIYHLEATDEASHQRFMVMERKLLIITTIGGALAVLFGIWHLGQWAALSPDYLKQGWLHTKLTLVFFLLGYHAHLNVLRKRFARRENTWSARALRWFNELPALFLAAIVILVVVKPF
jgi:protoporphyrinogen IX oxidase